MRAVAQRVAQRVEDEVALHLGDGAPDRRAGGIGLPALRLGRTAAALEKDGLGPDLAARRHQDGAVHAVVELAHIALPAVLKEQPHRGLGERPVRQAVGRGVAGHEMPGEHRDVARALAQRRDVEIEDVEAEEKVLAEDAV